MSFYFLGLKILTSLPVSPLLFFFFFLFPLFSCAFFFYSIWKENLSLFNCSCNYLFVNWWGVSLFVAIIGEGKIKGGGPQITHHHMGLLTLQVGLTHLHYARLCVGPTHQNPPMWVMPTLSLSLGYVYYIYIYTSLPRSLAFAFSHW